MLSAVLCLIHGLLVYGLLLALLPGITVHFWVHVLCIGIITLIELTAVGGTLRTYACKVTTDGLEFPMGGAKQMMGLETASDGLVLFLLFLPFYLMDGYHPKVERIPWHAIEGISQSKWLLWSVASLNIHDPSSPQPQHRTLPKSMVLSTDFQQAMLTLAPDDHPLKSIVTAPDLTKKPSN